MVEVMGTRYKIHTEKLTSNTLKPSVKTPHVIFFLLIDFFLLKQKYTEGIEPRLFLTFATNCKKKKHNRAAQPRFELGTSCIPSRKHTFRLLST